MKVNGKEINIFDEPEGNNSEILRDHPHVSQLLGQTPADTKENPMTLFRFANIYFNIKKQLQNGVIKLPYHERSFCKVLKENYSIEVNEQEMMELRDYFDNYYNDMINEKILNDYSSGMSGINLRKMGLE